MITLPKAQVSLPSDSEVKVARQFKASRDLVYRAYTTPALVQRRAWAKAGVALGASLLVLVPALMYFVIGIDGLRQLVEALARLGAAK